MIVPKAVKLFLAIGWLLFISVLFFLPGSDLPKDSWFDRIPQFDKLVHAGFFFVLLWFWNWCLNQRRVVWMLLLIAVGYGLLVEFIQLYFVSGRSFDLLDWAADSAGAVGSTLLWRVYKKNRPL
jgi:VanZ family protein